MEVLYLTGDSRRITVGRSARNDVTVNLEFISGLHFEIIPMKSGLTAHVYIRGRNGVLVNEVKYDSNSRVAINQSDFIVVGNITFIWMAELICISAPKSYFDNRIIVSSLRKYTKLESVPARTDFMPAIRRKVYIDASSVEIEAPPGRKIPDKPSVMLAMGPALTMALPMVLGMGRIISLLSAIIASIWAALNVINRHRKIKNEERRRRNSYIAYIDSCEEKIVNKIAYNKEVLHKEYPTIAEYLVSGGNPFILWNRDTKGEQGRCYRIGIGRDYLPFDIVIPKDKYDQINDSLRELPAKLKNKYMFMDEIPICIDFNETGIFGLVYNNEKMLVEALSAIIFQVIVLNHPRNILLCVDFSKQSIAQGLSWTRVIPWILDGKQFANELKRLEDISEGNCERNIYVFTDEIGGVAKLVDAVNSSVIIVKNSMSCIPAFVDRVLIVAKKNEEIISFKDGKRTRLPVRFDKLQRQVCYEYAMALARIYGDYNINKSNVPDRASFGKMYSDSIRIEDVLARWRSIDTISTISFPIGIGRREVFNLDISDKGYGPHGLVSGSTGSGKSELLTTIVLSAALNYPPDQLGFFLIDYKGGGMSNLFKSLPHLVGSISNLSVTESTRALISIKSENIRRQVIFNEHNVNNISDYTKLYLADKTVPAVPHIMIIIDEFAELKKEQPDFINELISVAAVGRSLGIHLLLATQKPAGVIDEKIRSNSRYRICLRVEDKMDSMDVIGKIDAAYIRNTGRAYIQVGNDEIFECVQTGYAMDVFDNDEKILATIYDDDFNKVCDINGDRIERLYNNWFEHAMATIKLADNEYENHTCIQLWKEELPDNLELEYLIENYNVSKPAVSIGLVDNVYKQSYEPLEYDYRKGNVLAVGTSRSGKTTLVSTIIASLINTLNDIWIYVIGLSAGKLSMVKELSCCGGYIGYEEVKRIPMMLKYVFDVVNERRRTMDSNIEYNHVILVIDNYAEMLKGCDEQCDMYIADIIKYGRSVKVTVIITAADVGMGEFPSRLLDKIEVVMVLGYADKYKASSYLGCQARDVPDVKNTPGRVIALRDDIPLECMIARVDKISSVTKKNKPPNTKGAPKYPYVPDIPSLDDFLSRLNENLLDKSGLPVGYEEQTGKIYYLPLELARCTIVTGRSGAGKKSFLNLIQIIASRCELDSIVVTSAEAFLSIIKNGVDKKTLLIIYNVSEILEQMDSKLAHVEDIELVSQIFDNAYKMHKPNLNINIIGLMEDKTKIPRNLKIYERIMRKPFVLAFGGRLDEIRQFDYSYIPYSKQSLVRPAGVATVIKYKQGLYYGDIIIPKMLWEEHE